MSRVLLSCLGLGAAAAVTLGGGTVASAFAGGLGGNLATDLYKWLHRRAAERFLDGWTGIDENHDISRALRLAQIDGLRAVLKRFASLNEGDPDARRHSEATRFVLVVKSFLDRETLVAQSTSLSNTLVVSTAEREIRAAVLRVLPDAFDQGLASRRESGERAALLQSLEQLRGAVEAAVLAELRLQTMVDGETFPHGFQRVFTGEDGTDGWFDLFVRDAASKIKEGGDFEQIWNAEQTALIKAVVTAHGKALDRIETLLERVARVVESPAKEPLAISSGGVRPVRPVRCVGRDVTAATLVAHLNEKKSVQIVLFGGPGMGKSTLSRAVASDPDMIVRFGTRRYFVTLEHAYTLAEMREAVARGFGVALNQAPDQRLPSCIELVALLGEGPLLLVLDNLETPWELLGEEVEAELAELVGGENDVFLLASIRGTALPRAPRWTLRQALAPLSVASASDLFCDIADQISADDPNLSALIEALGGIPLAIELVAAEARPFDRVGPVLARWNEIGSRLASTRTTNPSRLTSLDHSLTLSWSAPSRHPRTRDLLSLVAALPLGASSEMAESVFGGDGFDVVRDALTSGLCAHDGERLRLLPPVRDYIRRNAPQSSDLVMESLRWYRDQLIGLSDVERVPFCKAEDHNVNGLMPYAALLWPFDELERFARAQLAIFRPLLVDNDAVQGGQVIRVARAIRHACDFAATEAVEQLEADRYDAIACRKFVIAQHLKLEWDHAIIESVRQHYRQMITELETFATECLNEGNEADWRELQPVIAEIKELYATFLPEPLVGEIDAEPEMSTAEMTELVLKTLEDSDPAERHELMDAIFDGNAALQRQTGDFVALASWRASLSRLGGGTL